MIKDSNRVAIIAGDNEVTFSELLQRIHTYSLKTPKIMSERVGCSILPVRITGAYRALPRTSSIVKPCKVSVEYLPPIAPGCDTDYETLTKRVKDSIQGL